MKSKSTCRKARTTKKFTLADLLKFYFIEIRVKDREIRRFSSGLWSVTECEQGTVIYEGYNEHRAIETLIEEAP